MNTQLRRLAGVLLLVLAAVNTSLVGGSPPAARAADVTTVGLYQYGLALCLGCTVQPDYTFWSTTYGQGNSQALLSNPGVYAQANPPLQAWIAPQQMTGTVPLFDCAIGTNYYFNSLASNCEGSSTNSFTGFDGIDGYVYTSPTAIPSGTQAVPLYRCTAYFFGGQDWFMTATSPTCGGVPGYSYDSFLGYGLASSYDYSANAPNSGSGVTYPGCTPTPDGIQTCTPLPTNSTPACAAQTNTVCIVSTFPAGGPVNPCPAGGVQVSNGCLNFSGAAPTYAGVQAPCLSSLLVKLGVACGTGTFPLTPPWPLPSSSNAQVHNGPPPYDTLVVGDAASAGAYTSDEANFVYTVLGLCMGDGAGPSSLQVNFNQYVGVFGEHNTAQGLTPAADLGLTQAQAEAGVVAWVPPQCLHWYVDAPLDYDTYQQDLAGSGPDSIGSGTITFPTGSLANIQDPPGNGFAGATCGTSGAVVCVLNEQDLVTRLLPYDLAYARSLPAAIVAAETSFTFAQRELGFISQGCPSGQDMVFNPSQQQITNAFSSASAIFVATTGVSLEPGRIECITIPQVQCQSATSRLFGGGASFLNWINYLMDPISFAGEGCSYTIMSVSDPVSEGIEELRDGTEEFYEIDQECCFLNSSPEAEDIFGFTIPEEGAAAAARSEAVTSLTAQQAVASNVTPQVAVALDSRQQSTTSVVASSSDPAPAGSTVTYTAMVSGASTPTGTVTFSDTNGAICQNVPVQSGKATCQADAGNAGAHYILAGYSGDANLAPSFSPDALYQEVDPTNQSITFTSPAQTTYTYGSVSSFTVAATASSGLPVSLSIDAGSATVCSLSDGTVTVLSGGTCTIDASQGGNINYHATSGSLAITIGKVNQSITFTSPAQTTYTYGSVASFAVAATASSGLPVSLSIDAGSATVCSVSGGTVTILSGGICTVDASQAGNSSYNGTSGSLVITIAKAGQTITFGPLSDVTYGDPSFTLSAQGGASGNPVTFAANPGTVCTATGTNGTTINNIGVGTCTVAANQAGNASYNAAPQVSQSFQVKPAPASVVIPSSDSSPFQVATPGGTANTHLSVSISASQGDITTATVTYTLTPIGPGASYSCTVALTASGASATSSDGATCTAPGVSGGGSPLSVGVTFDGVAVNVYTLTVTVGGNYTGSGTNVVTIYDPSLGFATGGGTVRHNGVTAHYGFTARYLKSGRIQGCVVYVEHQASGDMVVKSNAVGSLTIVVPASPDTEPTIAYIQGKATANRVDNYSFMVTAIDYGEPGTNDQFGFQLKDPSGTVVSSLTFAPMTISGGNIVVHRYAACTPAGGGRRAGKEKPCHDIGCTCRS
jgi:hypothetical protein